MAKVYLLKVPLYVSNAQRFDKTNIFTSPTDLISDIKSLIDNYNSGLNKVYSDKRAKTTTIFIESITYSDLAFGDDLCLLLQVTACKTNFVDGFFQGGNNNEVRFAQSDRVGSDTNFFILYPNIRTEQNEKIAYWHLFIYEDPSKSNEEMVRIGKMIMNKILHRPITNIKSDKMFEDLKKNKLIPQIKVKLSSFSDDDSETPPYLTTYVMGSTLKQEKDITLSNVSIDDAISLYEDDLFGAGFDKKSVKYITANKRVLSVLKEFTGNMKETFEDSFNFSTEISEDIITNGTIFHPDIIKRNVEGIFRNYMYSHSD